MAAGFEDGLGVRVVRIIRSGNNDKVNGLIREQFVQVARHADLGIALLRVVGAAFENARQLHTLNAADHGRVKGLSSESESD